MVMDTMQIRLNKELTRIVDSFVKSGLYGSRSEVIRDAVRRFSFNIDHWVGIMPNTGDSVKEIREIRKKLSKMPLDLKEINRLGK